RRDHRRHRPRFRLEGGAPSRHRAAHAPAFRRRAERGAIAHGQRAARRHPAAHRSQVRRGGKNSQRLHLSRHSQDSRGALSRDQGSVSRAAVFSQERLRALRRRRDRRDAERSAGEISRAHARLLSRPRSARVPGQGHPRIERRALPGARPSSLPRVAPQGRRPPHRIKIAGPTPPGEFSKRVHTDCTAFYFLILPFYFPLNSSPLCVPIQTSPPSKTSFFQIGTVFLISSMAKRLAAKAASRWADETTMITLASPICTGPSRCTMAILQIGHFCLASAPMRASSFSAISG